MWRPIHKSTNKSVNKLLTDDEKQVWLSHPATKGLYKFEKTETPEPKKIVIQEPIEAKKFDSSKKRKE